MNYLKEVVQRRNERFREVERIKRALAHSVLSRIHEEWEEDPQADYIRAELKRPLDGTARLLLAQHPDVISSKVHVGRAVTLRLNEEAVPPILEICLGDCPDDDESL